jgi:hypothetical protein
MANALQRFTCAKDPSDKYASLCGKRNHASLKVSKELVILAMYAYLTP